MSRFTSLIKNHFQDKIVSNMLLGMCLIYVLSSPVFAEPAMGTQSVVRTDPKTGRLVRRMLAPPGADASKPKPEIQQLIVEKSRQHEIDPKLVESVIQVESNYNPVAVSPKGALGLMQLIPATARRFGVRNPFDAAENIEGGIKYLKHLQELFDGDQRLTLAAYNAGEAAVARYRGVPPYAETQNYVVEVGRRYERSRRQDPPVLSEMRPPRIEQYTDGDGRIHIVLR
jgi:soluble lytic murein transglycosylase-like protein